MCDESLLRTPMPMGWRKYWFRLLQILPIFQLTAPHATYYFTYYFYLKHSQSRLDSRQVVLAVIALKVNPVDMGCQHLNGEKGVLAE